METLQPLTKHSKSMMLTRPTQLPVGVFLALLGDRKVAYKNKVISSRIMVSPTGDLCRGTVIGGYTYIARSGIGSVDSDSLVREGHKILDIYHTASKKLLASVVNGKVVKNKDAS